MNDVPKKVKYAIRMIKFHTRLIAKYTKIINDYSDDCKKISNKSVNRINKNEQCEINYTIYDFLEVENEQS